jgi:hypothetical protein
MPTANITRRTTAKGVAGEASAPIYVDSDSDQLKVLPGGAGDSSEHLIQTSGPGGTVTQATSITTGVTLNKQRGQITTVASTLAAGAEETFTVTNSEVDTADVVVACLAGYAGAGTPIVWVSDINDGSFDITISNLHATNAVDDPYVINFVVLKGATA